MFGKVGLGSIRTPPARFVRLKRHTMPPPIPSAPLLVGAALRGLAPATCSSSRRVRRPLPLLSCSAVAASPFSSSSSSSSSAPPPPPPPPSGGRRSGRRRPRPGAPAAAAAGAGASHQRVTKKQEPPPFGPVATASPYVWTAPGMDPELLVPSSHVRGKARTLFTSPAAYLDPASLNYALPPVASSRHTEVAFLGRSNVGKSSLVGALLRDAAGGSGAGLVRTSKTPGCTRTLNIYRLSLGTDPLLLVDLPGYGFARAPEAERERWMDVSLAYLETRGMDVLRRTMLLIDARHGVKPQDEEVMAAFDVRAVPYQLVLTKADALRSEAARREAVRQALSVACKREHAACLPVVHLTSSKAGLGIPELREALAALMFHDD